ncbi:MAG: hypothetical protein IKA17_08290 [Clostridia bacterium]|nr:hypothetical protein [Clostridia bacterium]
MSYLTEKMAYIRGLAEGLEIDETTKEGKLLLAIVEALSDTADELYELGDIQDEMQLQLDEVDEDLDELESFVYGDEDEDFYDDDEEEYEVECPNCGDMICFDADLLDSDKINCPACGEEIELEFEDGCENCGCCEE